MGQGYSADWVVDDIIDRVKNQKLGCKYYKRGNVENAFEILVLEECSYLLDLEKSRIYTFEMN